MKLYEIEEYVQATLKGKIVERYLQQHPIANLITDRDVWLGLKGQYDAISVAQRRYLERVDRINKRYIGWGQMVDRINKRYEEWGQNPTNEQIQEALEKQKPNPGTNFFRNWEQWVKDSGEWEEVKNDIHSASNYQYLLQMRTKYIELEAHCYCSKELTNNIIEEAHNKRAKEHEDKCFSELFTKLHNKLDDHRDDYRIADIGIGDYIEIIIKFAEVMVTLFVRWNTKDHRNYFAQYPMRWKYKGKASTEAKIREIYNASAKTTPSTDV